MNPKEAMQALLDGKRVTSRYYQNNGRKSYVYLNEDGHLVDESGYPRILASDPTHPFSIFEEPNPHTKGTFAWAREEAKRGCDVRRASFRQFEYDKTSFTPGTPWALEHIDATDWEVAP